jgi:hypothetical protein
MTWTFDPALSTDKDRVRFYCGDTDTNDQLVADETINATLVDWSDPMLAAAVVCRSLAAKFARDVTYRAGDVSENSSDIARFYNDIADKLDPAGITKGVALAEISIGGLSISEKETLASNTDAVQPSFSRGMDDIPGGPSDGMKTTTDEGGEY